MNLRCPACGDLGPKPVLESEKLVRRNQRTRRRICSECEARFTTTERIYLKDKSAILSPS